MDLNTWLNEERGRMSAMAAHFGVTVSAVSQWRANGVPIDRMKAVRDYTGPDYREPARAIHGQVVGDPVEVARAIGAAVSRVRSRGEA